MVQAHLGDDQSQAGFRVPLIRSKNPEFLDDIVRQKLSGNFVDLRPGDAVTFKNIQFGGIDSRFRLQAAVQISFHRFDPGGPGIIAHPRPQTHPDGPIKIAGQRLKTGNLGHRVGEDFSADGFQLCDGQIRVKSENLDDPESGELQGKILPGLAAEAFPFRIQQLRP